MNSFKTMDAADSKKRSLTLPTAGDLYFHFSAATRFFQPLSTRKAESWSGPTPDLSHERIVRLEGARSFLCVVRTQPRLEKILADSVDKELAAKVPNWFDRLALELGRGLAQQLFGSLPEGGDSFFLKPSTPRYWPTREPEAICRIWVGATPVEIRFWMAGGNRSN
jgi:hypothetical protein